MATIPRQRIEPARTISGNSPQTLVLPLAASQTFKMGSPVYLVAGYVTVASATTMLLGFALEDATSGTAGLYRIRVALGTPDTLFQGNVGISTGQTTAITNRGQLAILYDDTGGSGHWTVNNAATTGLLGRLVIVDLHPADAVGDTGGRVLFTVRPGYYQLGYTS